MLVVFFKSIIVFFIVFVVVRLMGKRQLGEMQPFELVITLIIAEVACIPMNDPYIPFYAGVVPIITLAFLQILISTLSRKCIFLRRVVSGSSIIVIDRGNISYENLKKMNMNVNDLIEATRTSGYMDLLQISYAIFETNGNLCVVENTQYSPQEPLLPLPILLDGKFQPGNVELAGITEKQATVLLKKKGINNVKDVLYMDVRQDGKVYIAPKHGQYLVGNLPVKGGNW